MTHVFQPLAGGFGDHARAAEGVIASQVFGVRPSFYPWIDPDLNAFLVNPTSANLAAAVTDETGSGALVFATSPTLVTPALGTPSSGTLTNCTGLPLTTGITGTLDVANGGTGRATGTSAYALVATGITATGAQQSLAVGATTEILVGGGAAALPVWTTATGSGAPVRQDSPSLTTPTINTAASVGGAWTAAATWTLPAFTLGGTVTSNGQSFSGTIANLGTVTTADINGGTLDGTTVGATTATTGRFTTVESTVATGTAPLTVASTTKVTNLNADQLDGADWVAPGTIGSTTPNTGKFTTLEATGLITATGGQIKFPATQNASADANTLDDYEEGSTTPTPTAGGGSFTTVSAGTKYTKIGNRVIFDGIITITTNGTANSYVLLPLPFSAAETRAITGTNNATAVMLSGYVTGSNAVIRLYDGTYPGGDGVVLSVSGQYRI